MRLDLFLKTSRLINRRSLAQEFCDAGLVRVNDVPAKSSREVKAGDIIEIKRRSQLMRAVVLRIPESKQVSKAAAGELYELMEGVHLDTDPLS